VLSYPIFPKCVPFPGRIEHPFLEKFVSSEIGCSKGMIVRCHELMRAVPFIEQDTGGAQISPRFENFLLFFFFGAENWPNPLVRGIAFDPTTRQEMMLLAKARQQ
jgi:hypothetical protein